VLGEGREMSSASVEVASDESGGGWFVWLDLNESNVTNSSPHYQEDDARWCYEEGRVEVCVRISVMLVLTIITAVILLLRIVQYHWYRSQSYSQYVIYYTGLLLCLLSVIHWAYISSAIIDFFTTFLVVFQLIVIAQFFCSWAARILQRENVFKFFLFPALVLFLFYFLSVTAWAILRRQKDTEECKQPQWLLFSTSQLLLVQLFIVAVVYISRKLSRVNTDRSNRLSQKAQLWGLAIVYEGVTMVTFAYDLALLITRSNDDDCQTFFTSSRPGIVTIYIIHGAVKYLAPQWGISVLFSPLKTTRSEDDVDSLSWAQKPNYQSTFYRTASQDSTNETDHLIPSRMHSVNHNPAGYSSCSSVSLTKAILPRTPPVHSPYNSAPWLKTRPGQTFPTQQALLQS
jgi:hypothetical protein